MRVVAGCILRLSRVWIMQRRANRIAPAAALGHVIHVSSAIRSHATYHAAPDALDGTNHV